MKTKRSKRNVLCCVIVLLLYNIMTGLDYTKLNFFDNAGKLHGLAIKRLFYYMVVVQLIFGKLYEFQLPYL